MKKYLFFLSFLAAVISVTAQSTYPIEADTVKIKKRGGGNATIDITGAIKLNGKSVTGISNNSTSSTKDSTKLITEKAAKTYSEIAAAANQPILDSNLIVQLGSGGIVGGVGTGDTLAGGITLDGVFRRLLIKAIHPTYTAPTVGVSSSPGNGTYEIGTNIGTVTLSSTFTQNDAGSLSSTTYYQNSSAMGGNTAMISSLTTTQTFYVAKAYAQGACKNNNLGVQDCYGRITSGTLNSGSISFTPSPVYYIGTCAGTVPTATEIKAAAISWATQKGQSNVNITVSGTQYVFYAYPSSLGTLTRIYNSLGDFTLDSAGWNPTTSSGFNNVNNVNVPLNIYTLQSPQSGNVNGITFQ